MNNKRKLEIKTQLSEGDERYKLVKPSNLKSNVWHNFDLIQFDGKLEDYACCKKCKDVLAYSTKTGTGSLIRHNCDNQNGRRKTLSNHSRQQQSVKKTKSGASAKQSTATFDPLDYVQGGATPDDIYAVQSLYEQSSCSIGDGVGCSIDSKKRHYGESFDNTTNDVLVNQSSNPEPDVTDYVYGEYVDMGYLIKPETNQVANAASEIDEGMDDDDEDGNNVGAEQSTANDIQHCDDNDDNVNGTTSTSDFNLMELLMQSNEGLNALSYYDLHNRLNVKHREVVFNTLINFMNSSSECQKYNENLRRISHALRQLFPKENYSTLELHKYSMRLEMGEMSQEDVKLYNLLYSWNLTHLYDHFRAENITYGIIKFMETKHIDRLFQNLTIGDSILFDYHFKKWLENGLPEPLNESNIKPERKVLSSTSSSSSDVSLLERILKSSINGQEIKQFYQQNRLLTKVQRSMLINLIARYFDVNSICLTTELNNKLEKEILKTFPTEKINFYRKQNRSRLYAKVYNKRRREWKLQTMSGNEKQLKESRKHEDTSNHQRSRETTTTTANGC